MTHQPLTKAEREELLRKATARRAPMHGIGCVAADCELSTLARNALPRLLADLDAAEAKIRTQFQTTFDELRKALGSDIGSEGGLCAILTGIEQIKAQRDRAEAELDAERRMRVEAEAASDRAESERATAESIAAQATARMEEMRGERDALKAKLAALVDSCRSAETILGNMAKETGRTFGRWEIHHEPLRNDAQRMLQSFRAAIAAASGGAS